MCSLEVGSVEARGNAKKGLVRTMVVLQDGCWKLLSPTSAQLEASLIIRWHLLLPDFHLH